MRDGRSRNGKDWSGDWRSLALIWALPGAVMIAAVLAGPAIRGAVWTATLLWMGTACFVNARRCARTHCRFTGPFFLLMAALVAAYSTDMLSLGANGWVILGGLTLVGFVIIWWGSERLWGTFLR